MAQAAIRITPEMIDALKKKLVGVSEDGTSPKIDRAGIRPPFDNPAPQPAALSQSTIRAAAPVMDAPSLDRNAAPPPNVSTINRMQFSSQPNEFAAPDLQAAFKQNPVDDGPRIAANPVYTTGQSVPPTLTPIRPMAQPAPDVSSAGSGLTINRRVSPPLDQPSQASVDSSQISRIRPNPQSALSPDMLKPQQDQTQDAGVVPVADRRSAIEAASQSPSRVQPNQAAVSSPAPNPRQTAADARRAQLEAELTKLYGLENTKAVDKNGHLKSTFLGILRGYLQGGLGGAIVGGIRGGVHPAWDEEIKLVNETHKQQGKVDQALKIENQLARLDAMNTRTDTNAQKNSPEAQTAKSQKDLMTELAQRMRLAGGRLDPADTRAVELAQQLGIHGKQGSGFNAQRVRTLRGADGTDRAIYVDGPDEFHYINGDGTPGASLSERDKKYLALELEKENRQRALDGLGPIKFNDEDAPSAQPASTRPAPSAQTPSTTPSQARPVLIPTGERPAAVSPVFGRHSRGGRGGRSYSRGGGNQRDIGFAESGAADAMARAAEARSRGDEEAAAAWEAKANVENQRLQRAGGTPVVPPQKPNAIRAALGGGAMRAVETGADKASGRVSRSNFIKNNPQYRGKSPRVVDAAIRGDGYEPY